MILLGRFSIFGIVLYYCLANEGLSLLKNAALKKGANEEKSE